MTEAEFNEVRQQPLFAGLPGDELVCIRLGEIIELPAGAVLAQEGDPGEYFYLTLSGEVRIWRTYDRQAVLMATNNAGGFMGEITILLGTPWMATARVSRPSRFFRLDKEGFWKMMGLCRTIARQILRTSAERFRNLEGFAHQREKLVSLGTMAAGLAHELNNPASAALRAASDAQRTSDGVQNSLCHLINDLDVKSWKHLARVSVDAMEKIPKAPVLDPLARSDREEGIARWLEDHQIPEGWKIAGTFVAAGLDPAWLESAVAGIPAGSRAAALSWLESRLGLKILLKQIENSTGRIVELVRAVKSYTHLDNAARTEVDIHEGIESTLIMLGHKLKHLTLKRSFDHSLPRVSAYGGELNQVWTNLIDNAIDAVDGKGTICVSTSRDDEHVVVEITDNGSGICPEAQAHMFEPFFTTKSVGSGTGLGLVICQRIVADRHGGEIEFESKPGETRFRVRLPINAPSISHASS